MSASPPKRHTDITCPFCGLACDDLEIAVTPTGVRVEANGCPISDAAFAFVASGFDGPAIAGEPVSFAEAVAHAAAILRRARSPLITGLGTDIAGMRAALPLAERLGATLDHMHGEALQRTARVLQERGWITTTLSEVKNRADLILFFGVDVLTHFPRFFDRLIRMQETLFARGPSVRELVFVGGNAPAQPVPDGCNPTVAFDCPRESLGEVANVLRCLVRGQALQAQTVAGVAVDALREVAARLRVARYGVIVWAAAQLDFPHAELTIEAMTELVKELNRVTRCAGLPLGGRDGDLCANQVSTWQTGYPLPLSLARGHPEYDPHRYATRRLLEHRESDAMLWISAFDAARVPPDAKVPTIVLGRGGMKPLVPPEVYIPVATPGVDHAGHVVRCDGVVVLPLRALRSTTLPAVAQVLAAIEEQLRSPADAPC